MNKEELHELRVNYAGEAIANLVFKMCGYELQKTLCMASEEERKKIFDNFWKSVDIHKTNFIF